MWFVALPDSNQAMHTVYSDGMPAAMQRINYSSGNPWLIGRWRSNEINVIAQAGQTLIAVMGVCLADAKQMRADAAAASSTGRYEQLTKFPGSYFLLVAEEGDFRLFGDVVGLCRLFYTHVAELPVVSNRSDILASLARADVSNRWLAGALASATPPPLNDDTPWIGVHAVKPGQCIVNSGNVGLRTRTYWSPPVSNRSLRDGARDVMTALTCAVSRRVQSVTRVSCDLSGGKDSTALSFLCEAASDPLSRLLAVTMPSIAPDNDDSWWAGQAADYLPNLRRLVIDEKDCPLPYQDIEEHRLWTDEPSAFTMHSARYRRLVKGVLEYGSELHITGHGGDDVLEAPLVYLRDSLNRRPWRAIAHIRGYAALTGRPSLKYLSDSFRYNGYASWLRYLANRLTRDEKGVLNGWTDVPNLPPWISQEAASAVRESLLRSAAETFELAVCRSQFAAVYRVQAIGRMARLHRQFMTQLGLRVDFPYLDRTVVEACLAVRGDERTTPRAYKPLLDAAMSSVVPQKLLGRASKGHYTEDTMIGLRRQRGKIFEIFQDSALARRGLIDPQRLRDGLIDGQWESLPLAALTTTLACELWLRDAEAFIQSPCARMGGIQ